MTAGIGSSLAVLFVIALIGFFLFLYFSGRAVGAGLKYGGNKWRSGVNEADRENNAPPPPPGARPTQPPPPSTNAGWYKDPFGTGRRYWDGSCWTENTAAWGSVSTKATSVPVTAPTYGWDVTIIAIVIGAVGAVAAVVAAVAAVKALRVSGEALRASSKDVQLSTEAIGLSR
jgi:hypothetical protein